MKVLGVKVSDEIYEKFSRLGNISDNLRKAIDLYLDLKVNASTVKVNQNISKGRYQDVKVDKLSSIHDYIDNLDD
jgi:hypothetical protein